MNDNTDTPPGDEDSTNLADGSNENEAEHMRLLEALLFASSELMTERVLAGYIPKTVNVKSLLKQLQDSYVGRGVELRCIGKSWAFRTASDMAELLNKEIEVARKLSRAAVETLAIIAYHQPVTRAEVEEIRGVGMNKGTLDVLFENGWIHPKGRRQTPGRPVTWGTTDEFLDHFGLETLKDLPGMDDLKTAGLIDTSPAINAYRVSGDFSEPSTADENATEIIDDDDEGDVSALGSEVLLNDEIEDALPLDPEVEGR